VRHHQDARVVEVAPHRPVQGVKLRLAGQAQADDRGVQAAQQVGDDRLARPKRVTSRTCRWPARSPPESSTRRYGPGRRRSKTPRAARVIQGDEEAAMARTIDRDEVRRLMAQGAQIVDVLPAREYAEDHLPGAVNLPLRKIEAEALRVLDPSRPVVVYCADPG
jgi:hypothetical protein